MWCSCINKNARTDGQAYRSGHIVLLLKIFKKFSRKWKCYYYTFVLQVELHSDKKHIAVNRRLKASNCPEPTLCFNRERCTLLFLEPWLCQELCQVAFPKKLMMCAAVLCGSFSPFFSRSCFTLQVICNWAACTCRKMVHAYDTEKRVLYSSWFPLLLFSTLPRLCCPWLQWRIAASFA